VPAAFLRRSANVIAVSLVAALGGVVRRHGTIAANATNQSFERR
jgi:hypothetical protein